MLLRKGIRAGSERNGALHVERQPIGVFRLAPQRDRYTTGQSIGLTIGE